MADRPKRSIARFLTHIAHGMRARRAARHLAMATLGLGVAFGAALALPGQAAASTQKQHAAAAKQTAQGKAAAKKKTAHKTASRKTAKKAAPPRHKLATITSTLLGAADIAATTDAFAEADRQHWPEAMRHTARIGDPVAAKLVTWTRLTARDSGAALAEIVAFQEKNPEWPRQALLKRRAEEALLAFSMDTQDVLSWFAAHPPVTGEGKIRYGQALIAGGRTAEGAEWVRRAWVQDDFSDARQKEILASFRPWLTEETHRARLARLLWEDRRSDARMTAALIGDDALALADARIKLMSSASGADAALSRVPSHLQRDPGLLYDRIRYERRRGNDENVLPLLLTAPGKPHEMVQPGAWWTERKIAARKALTNGQFKEAYQIAASHGLKEGADFAEAEFLSGWIALQYLNRTGDALAHFRKLNAGVSTPISKARAEYWCARAASAAGDKTTAGEYYRRAASYPTTFYGQLATAALANTGGEKKLALPKDPRPSADTKARFEHLELVYAVKILHDLGRNDQMRLFMLHLADILDEPAHLAQLSDLAMQYDEPKLALRIAKTAAQRNIVMPQRAYPVALMPSWREKGPPVERALVYGLSRQESEFDPGAISSAGARGLMQLMPATARMVARQISVPYSPSRLTSDPAYNAMLGAAHLGDLVQNYSGSYIMSVAAYNAGSSRVSDWTGQFGDPRSPAVDPIDWIESIPFSETRNYVQRVMENLEVYRSRLAGKPEPVRIGDDLRRSNGAPAAAPPPSATPASDGAASARVPLASPLLPAGAMAPIAEEGDSLSQTSTHPATAAAAGAAASRTPMAPLRRGRTSTE